MGFSFFLSFFFSFTQVLIIAQVFAGSSAAAIHKLIGGERILDVNIKDALDMAGNILSCLLLRKLYSIMERM